VHARKSVRGSPALDVRLQDEHLVAVLGAHGATGEATHAGTNHNHVVLARFARKTVSGAGVGRLFVLWLERHVIAKRHDLFAARVFGLSNIFVRLGCDALE